jgi:hypothetical protein
VPAARWLRLQQCSGGAFQSYRADIAVPCTASNPATYSGPDTNSTALAAMALLWLGDTARARKALAWLRAVQRPDGGFPYYRGGASDTNSTGLVLAALRAGGTAPSRLVSSPGGRTPAQFLQSVQVRCRGAAADRGALAYQGPAPLVPNPLASAQGALGLAGTLPVTAARPAVRLPALSCSGGGQLRPIGISDVANGWLGRSILAGGGSLPNAFGPGRDWSATGWAVLALVAGRDGRDAVAQGTWRLARAAKTYVRPAGSVDQPGALGLLLLVAKATGRPVVSFGGVDLPARLRATMRG